MPLGRLERVDLRQVWLSEPADFTPWLAQEANLELLSETLGMELELVSQEQGVGPFRADIVCTDGLAESTVLIENQLERTDHKHLGQLLTYAAGLEAVSIVWIAHSFAEEHRAALDWLNNHTSENLRFFGLEVELWRIGDSHVAPKFNVVCKPNEWVKQQPKPTSDSPVKANYVEYWGEFSRVLANYAPDLPLYGAGPRHYAGIKIGRARMSVAAVVNRQHNYVRVELYMSGWKAKGRYQQLLQQKATIEKDYGQPLDWQEMPGQQSSRIAIIRPDSDIEDRSDWPAQHRWLAEHVKRFHEVFRARAAALKDDEISASSIGAELD